MKKNIIEVGDFVEVKTKMYGISHGLVMLKERFTSKHYYHIRLIDGIDTWAWKKDITMIQRVKPRNLEAK